LLDSLLQEVSGPKQNDSDRKIGTGCPTPLPNTKNKG